MVSLPLPSTLYGHLISSFYPLSGVPLTPSLLCALCFLSSFCLYFLLSFSLPLHFLLTLKYFTFTSCFFSNSTTSCLFSFYFSFSLSFFCHSLLPLFLLHLSLAPSLLPSVFPSTMLDSTDPWTTDTASRCSSRLKHS
jgi:hypothetical protein